MCGLPCVSQQPLTGTSVTNCAAFSCGHMLVTEALATPDNGVGSAYRLCDGAPVSLRNRDGPLSSFGNGGTNAGDRRGDHWRAAKRAATSAKANTRRKDMSAFPLSLSWLRSCGVSRKRKRA
jgi:hypothetical protein